MTEAPRDYFEPDDIQIQWHDPSDWDGDGLTPNQVGHLEVWVDEDGAPTLAASAPVTLPELRAASFKAWVALELNAVIDSDTLNPLHERGWTPSKRRPGHWFIKAALDDGDGESVPVS